jgi:hypothetical protein
MSNAWHLPAIVVGAIMAVVLLYFTTGRGGGITIDGPVVAHDRGWGLGPSSGMDAVVGGTLDYRDGCLLLGGDVVVWPDGTEWDAEREAVRLDDGTVLHVGDTVLGGGGMAAEGRRQVQAWKRGESGRALAPCLAPGAGVIVFNATAEPDVED